ncbi:Rz1-like lysis system protein LysC [Serratia fonticola]|uniref:Rz1-like lysis system protein LysC n=1 Tax=Serratia fonticola TaxID=47917 RepID=UPI001C52E18A|nr:Rz1-like lysis system protein LysC [Serratia fonticola]
MRLKMMIAPSAICLALLLSSCSQPAPPPVPQSLLLLPPESVFTPCEQPALNGTTWGDAVSYTLALQTALQICAGQVDTLIRWRSGVI